MLIVQTGSWLQTAAAATAAAARYPGAQIDGLVRREDVGRAQAAGCFARIEAQPADQRELGGHAMWQQAIDLCVLPFDDRFGVRYWHYRRLPLRRGVARIAAYDRRGIWKERGRASWAIETVVATVVLRAVQVVFTRLRIWARRWLDVPGIFALAVLANVVKAVRRPGSGGPRRTVTLFIPSLGVGGAQTQLIAFLSHVDRRRWDVEVATLQFAENYGEPAVRALGVPIVYLNGQGVPWMCGVTWRLLRHLRAHPCDVLHGWLHYSAALGAIAGTLARVPVIVGSLRSERPGRFPWFYSWWQRGLDVLTAPLHDMVIANSQAVRDENRRWAFIPDEKLATVYNGVDLDGLRPHGDARLALAAELQLVPETPLVGIVGRLYPEKDHRTFVRAAARVAARHPAVHFVIVGEGQSRDAIESEIVTLGLQRRIHLLGNRDDARRLIGALTVLTLTSTSEGFPNVLLEAAAAGVPVVTTAAGGAAEVIVDQETGFVVPCGDDAAVADRVGRLLADPVLRRQFAAAARDRAKRLFSAADMANAIEAVYVRSGARA